MSFLYPLVNSGVNFANHPAERRSILLSNIVSLILFGLGTLLFLIYFLWYGWSVVTAAIPLVALLCLLPIFFNRLDLSIIGRILLCAIIPISAMGISIYAKQIYYAYQEELDYFTFRFIILASCVFPAIFFTFREKTLLISTSIAGLLLLMLHDPLHAYFEVPYRRNILKESNYYFTNVVVLFTYSIMVGAVMFLKKISEQNEERSTNLIAELNKINTKLMEKNTEIEEQNLEISAQTENLNISQKKLQEAYGLIADQKELLLRQNKDLSSELVAMNHDLKDTNNELIKHNNELRQFSYTVSHNLRGPVASLSGLLNLIDPKQVGRENGEIFQHIKTSIERLEVIIKDLTQIIDIRQDIFHIRQKVSLPYEVHEIFGSVKKEIERHDIQVRTDFSRCSEIYSVKPMIHSMLYNLITNAIKYRAPERRPELEITCRENDKSVVIEVRDNGLGIDLKNQKQNLFKLYKRFHYHTEGRGLGLYLVKLQTEALGGTIDVESEINRFTKFTITLSKPDNVNQQILYSAPYAKIFFDASINAISVEWNGPVSSEQYRNVFQKCLEFIKAYNTPNYVADLTRQGYIAREDQQWMFQNVMPQAAGYGLKKIAAIKNSKNNDVSDEYFRAITTNVQRFGIEQLFFESYPDAVDWLTEENERSSRGIA
jgi:signal transduction histidine kinase